MNIFKHFVIGASGQKDFYTEPVGLGSSRAWVREVIASNLKLLTFSGENARKTRRVAWRESPTHRPLVPDGGNRPAFALATHRNQNGLDTQK